MTIEQAFAINEIMKLIDKCENDFTQLNELAHLRWTEYNTAVGKNEVFEEGGLMEKDIYADLYRSCVSERKRVCLKMNGLRKMIATITDIWPDSK